MSSPSSRCPVELQEKVVDCLVDDKRALEACSLVCRDWARRSRRYLYDAVTLTFDERMTKFFGLLTSRHCSIKQYVQEIIVDCPTRDSDVAAPLERLAGLPAIRSLKIKYATLSDKGIDTVLSVFRNVANLSFNCVLFQAPVDFGVVIGKIMSLKYLKSLSLTRTTFSERQRTTCIQPPPAGLQSLIISHQEMYPIVQWLSSFPPGRCDIRVLEVMESSKARLAFIRPFLAFFPQLSCLRFDYSSVDADKMHPDAYGRILDLRGYAWLRELTLESSCTPVSSPLVDRLAAILYYAPPRLQVLHLILNAPCTLQTWVLTDTVFKAAFRRSPHVHLRALTIEFVMDVPQKYVASPVILDVIRGMRLPRAARHGRVSAEVGAAVESDGCTVWPLVVEWRAD